VFLKRTGVTQGFRGLRSFCSAPPVVDKATLSVDRSKKSHINQVACASASTWRAMSAENRAAQATVRGLIWDFYRDLNAMHLVAHSGPPSCSRHPLA